DALAFPLRIISETRAGDGSLRRAVVGWAAGNMGLVGHGGTIPEPVRRGAAAAQRVLVEHGGTFPEPVRLSTDLDAMGHWRPPLPDGRPTYAVPYTELVTDLDGLRVRPSATALRAVDPRQALPCVTVAPENDSEDDHVFRPRPDLLASD